MTRLSLVDATARWKFVSPQERFTLRGELLRFAEFLETTVSRTRDLDHDLVCALDIDREGALDRARTLARDLARALDRALALARILARALDLDLDLVRDLARAGDLDLDLVLDLVLDLARDPDLDLHRARDLARARARARDLDLDLALNLVLSLAGDLARDLDPDRDLDRDLVLDLDHDLIEARDNLADAANNFVGADLTNVDLVESDLIGIRWDNDTRWPTPEWSARIQRASTEDPPESGVFIVLPEGGHNFADLSPLAIS